jgi:hypothetical protein
MPWDLIPLFLGTWLTGGILLAVTIRATRKSSQAKRILLRSLALAIAFTPSLAIAHGVAPVPAILILVVAPFRERFGLEYAALFGALPIAIVWLLIAAIWALAVAIRRKPS